MNRAILTATLVSCCTLGAHADLTEEETLQGLDRVMVIVEALHEDASTIGLTRQALTRDISEKLESADIELISGDERMAHERRPYLYINCNVIYMESIELASFSIDVEAHQRVTLTNGEKAQGLTWAKSYLGIQSQTTAAKKIRDVVAAYVDEFVEAVTDAPNSSDAGIPSR